MGKKSTTVIIAIVNKGYIDQGEKPMLDMFLDSFWVGEDTRELMDRLLLVAVDQRSFERCKFLRLHCYKLELILDEGAVDSNGEKLYMSNDFMKMMWRRTLFLGDILKRGYSFIFTDTDVMWLRNPFPRLSQNESIDLQISTDRFNGDEQSEANQLINTGFYMIRSNNKTISLFDACSAGIAFKEQDVLLNMMRAGVFRELGLEVRFLDTNYFSGFCEDSKDFRAVTTVHANCCRTIVAKVADLMAVFHDWKMFKRSSTNQTSTSRSWTNHKACRDSWN
ncbi:hypothetical protein CIPAW_07G182400 [Carya illinoinensis]|uniref:Nucleotide-diphospho-sugar transferase domain-containing protein n=1 Tax=Carya illinoinensis TaxID=32201 RepID=A0A8T1Q2Y0_CARIL|nr:hypothetical protein CIPAW_07G182400 [Carya illinoinensis]